MPSNVSYSNKTNNLLRMDHFDLSFDHGLWGRATQRASAGLPRETLHYSAERHPTKVGRFCACSALVHTHEQREAGDALIYPPSKQLLQLAKWAPVVRVGG